ncbi:restriction endonuclease subunit S [Thiolapillus sp.]|uniref:restriction endonuclease subunit S n=11 Tax=Thiolapillus sp. TaxID=2017437 RepID=UPI003AF4618B
MSGKSDKKKPLVPRLRFPEFREAGAWEVKRLGEVCEINPSTGDLPDNFIYIDLESVVAGQLVKKQKISKEGAPSRAQRVLESGDVIYQTVRPYQKNNYLFDLSDGNRYVASTGYAQFRAHDSENFLFQLIHTDSLINKVLSRCTGSNYPAINSSDLSKIQVVVPRTDEQQKIAHCLSSLDEVIGLQAKKVQALKQHKKGLMQQLFPAEGETTPRLRFPDFREAGAWEVKRLGEIFQERTERDSSSLELLSVTMSEGVVKTSQLDRKNNASSDLSNYKNVYPNDIVYNSMRMWQGASGVSQWQGIVSPAYTVITPISTQKPFFWAYYFKHTENIEKFSRYSQGVTSDTWSLKFPAFSSIKIPVPTKADEQQKIAHCLSSLDEVIGLESHKLDALKNLKKGLMQQLFPQDVA